MRAGQLVVDREGSDAGPLLHLAKHELGRLLERERVERVCLELHRVDVERLGVQREEVRRRARDVGRGHGRARDGVSRHVVRVPDGEDVESGRHDVDAGAVIREVRALVRNRRGADGDGVLRRRRRVGARVLVVVTGLARVSKERRAKRGTHGDGKVETVLDGGVDGLVERGRLASAEGHVGDGALVARVLALLLELHLLDRSVGRPGDTRNDVRHRARSASAKHLDGDNVGLLGNAVLGRRDRAGAVRAVAVQVLVRVLGDRLAPLGAALELDVVDVDSAEMARQLKMGPSRGRTYRSRRRRLPCRRCPRSRSG